MGRRGTLFMPCCAYPQPDDPAKNLPNPKRPVVRLVGSDGRVKTYNKPIRAAEVTRDFPSHLVCRSDAFCIGQKVPALREEEKLKPGNSYFLLPVHFFQSVLSFMTVASSFARTNGDALSKVFDIRRTPQGVLQVRINDEFIERIQDEGDGKPTCGRVCTTEELEKDYKQLVRCKSDLWKPKLETIKEKGKKLEAFESFRRTKKEKKSVRSSSPPSPPSTDHRDLM